MVHSCGLASGSVVKQFDKQRPCSQRNCRPTLGLDFWTCASTVDNSNLTLVLPVVHPVPSGEQRQAS